MLQNMDHIEASCIFYVEVGMLHRLEQSKIHVLTVTEFGIAMLTVHHLASVSCKIPQDFLRQTSADILSVEECTVYISHTRHFGGCSL